MKPIELLPEKVDLSVVIINYRMKHLLEPCLNSIFRQQYKHSFEIVLVNKPSGDGTEELIKTRYPQVRLISHPIFGIAELRNIGIKKATGRYFLMLDADTEVHDGAFDEMISFMDQHPEAGGAGAKTLRPDGSLEYSARRFYTLGALISRRTPFGRLFPDNRWERHHLMMEQNHDEVFEMDWMAGACYLMRRRTVEQVGLFDDKFYFGFEDVDWCFRAKKQGWRIYYIPAARIIHYVQRSSARGVSRMAFEHLKSGLRFYIKHYLRKST